MQFSWFPPHCKSCKRFWGRGGGWGNPTSNTFLSWRNITCGRTEESFTCYNVGGSCHLSQARRWCLNTVFVELVRFNRLGWLMVAPSNRDSPVKPTNQGWAINASEYSETRKQISAAARQEEAGVGIGMPLFSENMKYHKLSPFPESLSLLLQISAFRKHPSSHFSSRYTLQPVLCLNS